MVTEVWYYLWVLFDIGPSLTDQQRYSQELPRAETPLKVSKSLLIPPHSFSPLCGRGVVARPPEPSTARAAKRGRDGAERNTTPSTATDLLLSRT